MSMEDAVLRRSCVLDEKLRNDRVAVASALHVLHACRAATFWEPAFVALSQILRRRGRQHTFMLLDIYHAAYDMSEAFRVVHGEQGEHGAICVPLQPFSAINYGGNESGRALQ
jgi:hypothetical protein